MSKYSNNVQKMAGDVNFRGTKSVFVSISHVPYWNCPYTSQLINGYSYLASLLGEQLDLRKALTKNANKMKNSKITTSEANFVRRMWFFLLKPFPPKSNEHVKWIHAQKYVYFQLFNRQTTR